MLFSDDTDALVAADSSRAPGGIVSACRKIIDATPDMDNFIPVNLEPLHPLQLARLRAMTIEEKWTVFRGMLRTAREVRRKGIRRLHPDWDNAAVERALAQEFARGRT